MVFFDVVTGSENLSYGAIAINILLIKEKSIRKMFGRQFKK